MKNFSNLSSGEQYFSNDIKKFCQKSLVKNRNLSEEKKTHPEHKYFVTFVKKVGAIKSRVRTNRLISNPQLELKYHFKFELRQSMFSMESKKFFVPTFKENGKFISV